ncbi:MAG: hypothetical protein HOP06_11945 [Methylotenera sp.]|nr:hypothetical protein [Methylotenera sp.]
MKLNWIKGLIYTASVACIVGLGLAIVEAENDWQQFAEAHECKKVAHINGDVFNTFGSDSKGNMTVGIGSMPDKTGWLCNDGVTYYR